MRMRLLILLITLIPCAYVLLIGCDQEMTQPMMEIVKPPQDSLQMGSLEKAQAALESVNEKRTEAHLKAEEAGDFSTILVASEDIFREELGLRKGLWVDLVEIYRQEHLENPELLEGLENLEDAFVEKIEVDTLGMFYFQYIRTFDGLIVEYLRLSFENPEKSEEERLMLFRESVRDGAVAVKFP